MINNPHIKPLLQNCGQTYLPADVYRSIHHRLWPGDFRRYQKIRNAKVLDSDTYSLQPFIERKAIFVHLPKCAGISVAKALFGCPGGAHRTIRDYRIIFTDAEFRSFFKFTFVRNPWDRLVSAYFFLRDGGINEFDHRDADETVNKYQSFDDFVRKFFRTDDYYRFLHIKPQYTFLTMKNNGPILVDYVGRFETLDRDFEYITNKIGKSTDLKKHNVSKKRENINYQDFYDDETRQIVANAYARDISLFGYKF